MCVIEPEWKFLNDKSHEVSSFYELPKSHKAMIIESVVKTKSSEIIEVL